MTMPAVPPSILIVADQPLLRLAALDLAEQAGFPAVAVADARDATALLATRNDIGVVLADLDLPGESRGAHLSAVITRHWPWIRVLILTDRIDPPFDETALTITRPCADRVIVAALSSLSGSGSAGSGR